MLVCLQSTRDRLVSGRNRVEAGYQCCGRRRLGDLCFKLLVAICSADRTPNRSQRVSLLGSTLIFADGPRSFCLDLAYLYSRLVRVYSQNHDESCTGHPLVDRMTDDGQLARPASSREIENEKAIREFMSM
jgi:hypothetical protein